MVMKLDEIKTLFAGFANFTLNCNFRGFVLTTFLMPECGDAIC